MRLLLGIQHFDRPNGATTYTTIVARHLARLGHEVTIHTPDAGVVAGIARSAGIPVTADPAERPDAILAQDQMVAYALAERWPDVPQLFVAHGAYRDENMPPQADFCVGVVALNDRVAGRIEALADPPAIARLRQPIDVELFRPRGRPNDRPRRAALFGNNLHGKPLERITDALERAGLEVDHVGWHGRSESRPQEALGLADMVIGYGRCALEGMASGRPTYVYDHRGGDGWVTGASYPALEGNGFAGTATDESLDMDVLATTLASYDPELGDVGRKLVARHHDAFHHAEDLIRVLGTMQPTGAGTAGASELTRLSQRFWDAEWRVEQLLDEATDLHERLQDAENRMLQAIGNMDAEARVAVAARERAAELEREVAALKATSRYRLAGWLASPLDRLRRPRS